MITEKKATKYSKPAKAVDGKKPSNKTLKNKKSHKLGKGKPATKKKKSMYEDKLPSAELHGKKGKLIQDKKLKESFDSLYENFMNSTESLINEGWFSKAPREKYRTINNGGDYIHKIDSIRSKLLADNYIVPLTDRQRINYLKDCIKIINNMKENVIESKNTILLDQNTQRIINIINAIRNNSLNYGTIRNQISDSLQAYIDIINNFD